MGTQTAYAHISRIWLDGEPAFAAGATDKIKAFLQELKNFILQNKCHLQNLYEIATGYFIHTSFPYFASD